MAVKQRKYNMNTSDRVRVEKLWIRNHPESRCLIISLHHQVGKHQIIASLQFTVLVEYQIINKKNTI